MKLIIGLGNPGQEYVGTRHNIGFFVVEHYAATHGGRFQAKPRFKADVAELMIGAQRVLLAKPTTYYNMSGETARAICDFYKIAPQDVLVVHDELDLPFGTIRSRLGGSSAGNNGVQSISAHIGADSARLRIGSSNEHHRQANGRDFVLSKLAAHEAASFATISQSATRQIERFIDGTFDAYSESLAPDPAPQTDRQTPPARAQDA